ncbi:DUF624 domain-containing protein [Nonomuraea soli]|uniref:Putative membrane protein YesL n=1 Tax=Nonomuraea soli TaxID=1032476 RepID=A0A7W0CH50_9ACTN|nr:DUF624 domain-containing protein [Nonomuraea soli]MBA2890924.1 putative membrane protein YesL [Nonomuraea soli]
MASPVSERGTFGSGPLSRAGALIYSLIVTELLFLATGAPALVLLTLLERDAGNAPLAALCVAPLGPAASAALYAVRHRGRDLADLHPARVFWRGYRANAAGALKVWLPWLAVLAIIAINLAHFDAAGVPGWWAVLMVVVAAGSLLWMSAALVITSLFAFRARDVARLAAWSLTRFPGLTLTSVCLVVLAGALAVFVAEPLTLLPAPVFAMALLYHARPMIAEIEERFTA